MNGNLLHDAFERQATSYPDNIAIDDGDRQITYGDLAGDMRRLASTLLHLGIQRQDRVGILIDNGIAASTAILGTLRSDACFVPFNPAFPALRIATIATEAQVSVILTTMEHLPLLEEAFDHIDTGADIRLIILDGDTEATIRTSASLELRPNTVLGADALKGMSDTPQANQNVEEDLAYILFTSGTTGKPKGVMVQHRAICSTINWGSDYFDIGHADRLSNHSRLSFDVSLFDIFCAFSRGATLCPITSQGDLAFPAKFIERMEITIWFSVPSVIATLSKSRQLESFTFTTLRAALFAGEALLPDLVTKWIEHQPQTPIYNLYGPTEAAIVCTVFLIEEDSPMLYGTSIPIGYETRDSELIILNEKRDELVAPGEIGQLMICGTQLAAGYWRQPDLTETMFLKNPLKPELDVKMYDTGDLAFHDENGVIYFVGRRDSQVKVRGYRIELGEIEGWVGHFPGVHEAVVVCLPGPPTTIVAAVAAEADAQSDKALLAFLSERLPGYMLPSEIYYFDSLPRNSSGKIDRNRITEDLETA